MELEIAYLKYYDVVYKQCLWILKNPEDAEDATQDIFLRLLSVIDTFRGECTFSTWLYRITINEALGNLRRKENKISRSSVPIDESHSVANFDVTARIDLERALSSLTSAELETFHLSSTMGLTHAESGRAKRLSRACIKARVWRTRKILRESLHDYGVN